MPGLILVIGSEGLVGSRYLEISEQKKFLHTPKQVELDITNLSELKAVFSSYDFSAVVNFAAFTDVDLGEEERGNWEKECWRTNVDGVKNLVEALEPHKEKIHFVQISTDMVFPGTKVDPGPYLENHPLDHNESLLTWYGYTKAKAEEIANNILGDQVSILRLANPVRAQFDAKLDYLHSHLSLYDKGKLYPLFSDQQISISFIDEVCKTIDTIITGGHRGIFHSASRDLTTPYQITSYMLERTRGIKNGIESVSLDSFLEKTGRSPARYPKYGGLSVSITEHKLGLKFSSWREIVDKLITQGFGRKST